MLKRMFVFTVLLIGTLLLVNQVVIPHVRRSRGHDELRHLCLQKGREVIARAIAAHGGFEVWKNKIDASFRLHDEWNSLGGAAFAGWLDLWPERDVETRQYYLLRRNAGRIEMDTEAGHHVWGYSDFHPWALVNGRIDAKNLSRAKFTVPMINYLFELPYKFLDPGAFPEFVNEIKHGHRIYDRVRVTLGLNAGNYPPNEYVADFDQATGRLAHLEYTVREKMPSCVTFRADFENYRQIDGLWIPAQINFRLTEPLIDLPLHAWRISDVRFNTGASKKFFTLAEARLADAGAP